ncbi:EAL domain-containing protein [Neptuniibacter sp.]|uniref:EAL domain-containing protein n=1 Tax=Neptuniibacter sp. TaxID=1962643 RepID=UPI0026216AA9|nr:EAL domain-containing protein [Neptuniibacter sp.]MCP4597249.1 EAL domain-containing protein [Neptuniibacter sp.]
MEYVDVNRYAKDCFELLDLIERQRFGVEYQPIIDAHKGEVIGYEALARFYTQTGERVSPLDVFRTLHDSPLLLAQVELQLKRIQLRFRPANSRLFLNLDPHAFSVLGPLASGNAMMQMLSGHEDLVVEIIENTDVNDARMSNNLSRKMHEMGFSIALDDVGAPDSMLSLQILADVDFIKLDRCWLRTDSKDSNLLLRSLVNYAQLSGKKTVLEGVETAEDLAHAVNLGVDYVQGFFYRELFIEES